MNVTEPEKYEYSSEKDKCDKWIAWQERCRECLFQVLCKFNSFYKKTHDNRQK
jgi:hypothetical protein